MKIYGAIKNILTQEEYVWDAASAQEVLNDLLKLSGTCYGIAWKFAGDQTFEESDIFCADTQLLFGGKRAVHELRAVLSSGWEEAELAGWLARYRGF